MIQLQKSVSALVVSSPRCVVSMVKPILRCVFCTRLESKWHILESAGLNFVKELCVEKMKQHTSHRVMLELTTSELTIVESALQKSKLLAVDNYAWSTDIIHISIFVDLTLI